jgi:AmiR/NasT family two-component response regulator
MPSVCVLLIAPPDAPAIETDLVSLGVRVSARCDATTLLREALRLPQEVVVVAWDAYPATGLLAALQSLQEHGSRPVLLFTSDADVDTLEAALRAGVHGYVVNGYAPARLRSLIQLARARHAHDAARRRAYVELEARFEERKLVDRAKGILMRSRQIGEDEAFRMLRGASMQEQQRVGQLAHRVIEAARDADAVNRAGRLRMLSQRLVKLQATRTAVPPTPQAAQAVAECGAQVANTLEHLERALSRATFGDLLDAAAQAWQSMQAELRSASPGAVDLVRLDAAAERLLECADTLTLALEVASPLATLGLVNRAGRQRMLSQRLAKQALVAALCDGDAAQRAAADAVRTVGDFETTLDELKRAPLSSPATRADLDGAAEDWRNMLDGMRRAADEAGRQLVVQSSDALLERFERLTAEYGTLAQQLFRTG